MKIIGMAEGDYIALISHSEIEKVFDKYYGNLGKLKVGETIDLGAGHDFRGGIKAVCKEMIDANKQFSRAQSDLIKFALMVSGIQEGEEQ